MTDEIGIAVTGHRPDEMGGYSVSVKDDLVALARAQLVQPDFSGLIYVGMALGWDQAVAQACVDLGRPFVACIPIEGQDRLWPRASRDHYWRLMGRADRIVHVWEHDDYPMDSFYPNIRDAMHARNRFMVDRARLLLALWDGSPGGTWHAVSYAHVKRVPVTNVWNLWAARKGSNDG